MKITITIDRGGVASEFMSELARGAAKAAIRAFDDLMYREDPEVAKAAEAEREERLSKHRLIADLMRDAAKRMTTEVPPPEPAPAPAPDGVDRQSELIAKRVAMRANLRDLGFCPCTECTEYALSDRHGGVTSDGALRPGMRSPAAVHDDAAPPAAPDPDADHKS